MIVKSKNRWICPIAMGIGIGLFCYFYGDPYLSKLCRSLSHPLRNYVKIVSLTLFPPFHITFWCAIYLTAKCRKKNDPFLAFSRQIFYLLLLSLPLVYGIKIVLGRARPELLAQNIYGFYFITQNHHYHSFPSGHAAVATCLLMPFLRVFPNFRILWITLFLFLSGSRVLLNYHYASDIVASAMICYVLEEFLLRKYRDIKKRKSDLYNPIS